MKLIVFSKGFRERSIDELVEIALEYGFDGYDLCVRPEYPVNPDNAAEKLGEAAEKMRAAGLDIPMVTGNFDLLAADHPTAEPILAAMAQAGIGLIKLGYFSFDPLTQDYWQEVDRIRRIFEGWQELGRKHNVKVCYHTHSGAMMGRNCASLAHLIRGFDPRYIGAYVDTGHLVAEGEEFCAGVAMVKEHLSIVSVKDVLIDRNQVNGHGSIRLSWLPAAKGMVNWTAVFDELARIRFDGPLSIHCEFEVPQEKFMDTVKNEVRFFKAQRERVMGKNV